MSVETWEAEFYPTPAAECEEKDAIAHSLRKWEGTLPENLAKHEVGFVRNGICNELAFFSFGADCCALCWHYFDRPTACARCPLARYLGRRCDDLSVRSEWEAAYAGNPLPMIEALRVINNLTCQNGRENVASEAP